MAAEGHQEQRQRDASREQPEQPPERGGDPVGANIVRGVATAPAQHRLGARRWQSAAELGDIGEEPALGDHALREGARQTHGRVDGLELRLALELLEGAPGLEDRVGADARLGGEAP